MTQYNHIMLGKAGVYAEQCKLDGFIGADFDIQEDLTGNLTDDWCEFNKKYVPLMM